MARGKPQKGRYLQVTVAMDEDLAVQLDRAMIAFNLENRAEVVRMATAAWLSAVLEDATLQQMCLMAVEQVRKAEYEALTAFFQQRAKDFGV